MSIPQHLEEARAFLEELSENPPLLPYEPTLMPLLFAATREGSSASIPQPTALIERSQKLATKVLSVANSACYALESHVTSINRAVAVLGFNEVRALVIMLGAASALKGAKLPADFDSLDMWRHQLLTAAYAKALATGLRPTHPQIALDPDEAYAAGLLHDIGKVLLAGRRPHIWSAIAKLAADGGLSFSEAENAYWGMDHALTGAQVLHFWKLPLVLTDTINWHHSPQMAPSFALEAGVVAAADALAHLGLDASGNLPQAVLSFLPPGANAATLAAGCVQAADKVRPDTVSGLQI